MHKLGIFVTRVLWHGASIALFIAAIVPQAACGRSYECIDGDGYCKGTTAATCSGLTGCSWLGLCGNTSYCTDANQAISSMNFALAQSQCASSAGCAWDGGANTCTPDPTEAQCTQPAQSDCEAISGCLWRVGCRANTTVNCTDAQSQIECNKVGRCEWVETGPNTFG
jgi:hypothetical protein